tara:strand:- start:342 stop:1121 length:780 start_codon:yes stop_codon:yes gene_type:complete
MKNILFLLLFIPIITLSQTETYVDGKLIKSIVKNDIEVSTSFKGFHKEDGKYYTFEISVFNGSSTNKLVKVQDFAAFIETRKGNKPLDILTNKEYQKIKQKKDKWQAYVARVRKNRIADEAGEVVSNTESSGSSSTYGYSNTNAYASTSGGSYAYGNAYTNSNSSTSFSGRSKTTTTDGAARYAAQQNEDMKYQGLLVSQEESRSQWSDVYFKSNNLPPSEYMGGLINLKYSSGENITINIKIEGINYTFIWTQDESEM